jgi:DNA mismatch endonuclease (patch repair protein)
MASRPMAQRSARERNLAREVQRLRRTVRTNTSTSEKMSRIRTRGTGPEIRVRAIVQALGYRFRTKNQDLLGSPDLANRSARWVVFVHGCFWHQHKNCSRARLPRTNAAFWRTKLVHNATRDKRVIRGLRKAGYVVVTVWTCELRKPEKIAALLKRRLPTSTPRARVIRSD